MKAIGVIVGIILGIIVYFSLISVLYFVDMNKVLTNKEAVLISVNMFGAGTVGYYVSYKFIKWYNKHLY